MKNEDPYNMKDKTTDELLRIICGKIETSIDHQYAKIELKKREFEFQNTLNEELLKQQHKFNLSLSKSQNKIIIIAAIITALSGLAGVLVGAGLTQQNQKANQNELVK